MTYSASDHDNVRFQQIDDIAEPDSQNIGGLAKNLGGEQVALFPGFPKGLAGDLFAIATREFKDPLTPLSLAHQAILGAPCDRPACRERFYASRLAAVALCPAKVDGVVASFSCSTGAAKVE